VVGPGAIGGFVAARLTEAGWPVRVVARQKTLAALRAAPMRLVDDGVEREVRLTVIEGPPEAGSVDLALVCVKSFDTEDAGRTMAPALASGAVVLSLQNGVENPQVLAATCPGAAVGGVAVYLGCQRIAPDHVVRRPSRDPATGRIRDLLAGGGPGSAGDALVAVGAAIGVPTRVDERPEVALWTKLVANASLNTVTALGRANVGRVFSDPEAVKLMLALGHEVVAVAHALDVPVPDDTAEQYLADARQRLPRDGGSSTLFDLVAGQPLESAALVGAVVREGERLRVPVPVSRACAALLGLLDPAHR
jgi:2-dehydropantoate 2-reductase